METFSRVLTDVAVEHKDWESVDIDDRKRLYVSFGKTTDGFKYICDAFDKVDMADWYEALLGLCEGIDQDSLEDLQDGLFHMLDNNLFEVLEELFYQEKGELELWDEHAEGDHS